jgi:preprotein translocase subunit SecE
MNFWAISITLLIAAIVAMAMGYAMVGYAIIAAVAVGALLIYRITVLKFVGEVKVELDKCSWPWDPNQTGFKKYKELLESTIVVIISVVLLAGFVTSSDWILTHLVGALTGTAILK